MRVLLLTENFDPARGGSERSLLEMGQALSRLGLEVEVLANESPLNCPWLHTLSGPSISRRHGLLGFARRAQAWIAERDYDLIHSITPAWSGDVYQPRAGCLPALFENSIKRPQHGLDRTMRRLALKINAKRQALLNLERALALQGRGLICPVSRHSAEDFLRHYGLDRDRVRVVFNGVDLQPPEPEKREAWRAEQRALWGVGENEKVLLFVGHDFDRKGLATAIEALGRRVAEGRRRWWLIVVGQDDGAAYFKLAVKRRVAERVRWIGQVKSVVSPMVAADLLALPTFFDPCSRAVLEAMILGLPAATTAQDGAAEAMRHNQSGFILKDARDAAGLLEAMKVIEDEGRAAAVSQAAQAQAAHLHVDRLARELVEVFQEIKNRKGRVRHWVALDGGLLQIRKDWCPALETSRFGTLAQVFDFRGGQLVKKVKGLREMRRFDLSGPQGAAEIYLKRIWALDGAERRLAQKGERLAGAWAEAQGYSILEELGIDSLEAVAVGGEGRRSFLMTLALEGAVPLNVWSAGEGLEAEMALRRRLLRIVARTAARLHRAGFYHQDFNLHHLFWNQDRNKPRVFLMDLQRLRPLSGFGWRGRLKDLAELTYSSSGLLKPRDRLAFALTYTGNRWGLWERLLFGAARIKARRTAHHSAKHNL